MRIRTATVCCAALLMLCGSSIGFAGKLRGEARSETRKPVPGATVLVVNDENAGFVALTSTNDVGFLALDDIPSGSYSVQVIAPGWVPYAMDQVLVQGPFRAVVDIVMSRTEEAPKEPLTVDIDGIAPGEGQTLEVRALDVSGEPLAGVRVSLEPNGHRSDPLTAETDSEGLARIEGAEGGAWQLTIARSGWTRLQIPKLSWNAGKLDLLARMLAKPLESQPEVDQLLPPAKFLTPPGPDAATVAAAAVQAAAEAAAQAETDAADAEVDADSSSEPAAADPPDGD